MIDWSQCPDVESVPDWVEVDHLAATSEQVEPECEDSTPGATQGSRASVRRIAICPCQKSAHKSAGLAGTASPRADARHLVSERAADET